MLLTQKGYERTEVKVSLKFENIDKIALCYG